MINQRLHKDVYMTATAVDADGKVVATIADVAQVKVLYDEER